MIYIMLMLLDIVSRYEEIVSLLVCDAKLLNHFTDFDDSSGKIGQN